MCSAWTLVAFLHLGETMGWRAKARQIRFQHPFHPMAQDFNAQFDHTVMDMIDHSPVGAVPSTPAYQDALIRLYASHQVYASADHRGGHVTARSLAALPVFHAANLDDVIAGRIGPDALEKNASIFDRYVLSLPEPKRKLAESHRVQVAGRPAHHRKHGAAEAVHDPIHTLILVPGTGPHPGLPGNYLHGSILQLNMKSDSPWAVHLHDSDDGTAVFEPATLKEAFEKAVEVFQSAPFAMSELQAIGFRIL
jgi:hypothetical protein